MIYDTFLFSNETELLKIRLQELWDVVDMFVLAESRISHRGTPKPLYFSDNKSEFSPWLSKITAVVFDMPKYTPNEPHANGLRQSSAVRALRSFPFRPGTVVYGDADEIVRPNIIKEYSSRPDVVWWCDMRFYHYFLNCQEIPTPQGGRPTITNTRLVKTIGLEAMRWKYAFPGTPNKRGIPDAGWHFSYLGGAKALREKISMHVEGGGSDWIKDVDDQTLQERINAGQLYDGSQQYQFVGKDGLPNYVQNNWDELASKGMVKAIA